jgi:hypothetical protein
VDVTQPTWQLIQPPGVCKVVVVGQQGSWHGSGMVWSVVQVGAEGQVAELNVVPQKAITLMLDILKRDGKYGNAIEKGKKDKRMLTIIRLRCSFEIGVAKIRDGSDLSECRWHVFNID